MATATTPESTRTPAISIRRRGVTQRWSRTLIPTTREAPSDAETPSHIMLHRAGYIRRVGAGIYDYLPLAWRTIQKISDIVREEMNAAGASEMLMPALEPIELLKATGREEAYGDLLFKVTDRHGRVAALGPTHEEVITDLLKGAVTSHRQLPLNIYQIQTKFRDEFRPRSALLRCREFLMKDAYSFSMSVEGPGGLNEMYDAMYTAYTNIFRRCGLSFTVVEAESGPIGGSASHEFMVNAASGEDTVLVCRASGYAANVEKCEIGERKWSWGTDSGGGGVKKHHTPGLPGIDAVAGTLGVTPPQMLKTIVFKITGPGPGSDGSAPKHQWILATVRGDHEVNEGKVKAASGCAIALANDKEARAAGFAIGYVSPRVVLDSRMKGPDGLCKVLLLVDHDAAQPGAWATGADENDYHVTGWSWRSQMGPALDDPKVVRAADIRNAMAGDPSPRSPGSRLEAQRGIEVGHIFKLGTKYSDAMGFSILDEKQQRRAVIMGCYGIGVSRTMAACVEMSHDADGIIWPAAIAPFHVLITVMKPDAATHAEAAAKLATELSDAGVDVLIDDRDERPGVKFKDADLIGLPIRLTVGDKSLAEGAVEYQERRDRNSRRNVPLGQAAADCAARLNG